MSADVEYRINDTTKWGMLSLALLFDGVQFATAGITDTFITAFAAMVFGMLFIERGAFTLGGKGLLKTVKFIIPIAELLMGNVPGITLEVWVLIKSSRLADRLIPESFKTILKPLRRRKALKNIAKNAKTVRHQGNQLRKYTGARSVRAKRRAQRRAQETLTKKTSSKQQRLQNTKVTT